VQGDWSFDTEYWPDPSAMTKELKGLGMEMMVTIWPFSHNGSKSYPAMVENGEWASNRLVRRRGAAKC
jgi:alpha-D-xyloside xylohydrolase